MARILIIGDLRSPLVRARGLIGRKAGHSIYCYSILKSNLPGVEAFGLPNALARVRLLRGLLNPIVLWRTICLVQPDLIHVHYALQGLGSLPLSTFHPLVVSVMGGDILQDQGFRGFHAVLGRWLLSQADCITTKSEYMDGVLDTIGINRSKVRRVTWGVDLDRFRPDLDLRGIREQLGISVGTQVFFDPRIAQPLYNKHIILAAFAEFVSKRTSPAILVVAEMFGEPKYVSRMRAYASTLGISECVRFVGAIEADEIPYYYALADCTISVPNSDGLPQTIYEALASGTFLILGNLPQYKSVVDDHVTGILVPVGDISALTKAMEWVSAHPDIRMRARQVGRAYVKRNADSRCQEQLVIELYEELLQLSG